MGQKDLWQSDYFDSNVRFADVYNGIFFHGEEIIKPEELEPCDSVFVQHFQNQNTVKVICDKIRKWKGQHLAILPLENQSYVDYRMVLRIMQEEILGYEKQRKEAYEKAKQDGYSFDKNEFLSGMKKDQKFTPVIPLILYMGTDSEWDGAKTLYQLLEIDDEIKPFVNDYKLNFYDYHNQTDFSNFKTENKLLFEVLANAANKGKVQQLFLEEAEKYSLDREAASALIGMAGIKMDLDKLKEEKDGKVEYKMCKAFQEITQEARDEGFKLGIESGYKDGRESGYKDGIDATTTANITALMETMHLTLEQALDALKITGEQRIKFYS